jgi:hypothetical protein
MKKMQPETDIERKISNFRTPKHENDYFSKPNFIAADLRNYENSF